MADLNLFVWKDLTRVVQRFVFPNFWFVNNIPINDTVEGTVVQWDIEKPPIAVDTIFTTDSGTAHPLRMSDYGTQSYRMPVSFVYTVINSGDVVNLRRLGGNQRDDRGERIIMNHLRNMVRLYDQYLIEWFTSQVFDGTVTITVGITGGASKTIDFFLPASHNRTASASWATVGTNIMSDIRTQKVRIAQDYGDEARLGVHNDSVSVYLMRNTDIGNLVQGSPLGSQMIQTGRLTNFFVLTWVEVNHRFASANQTEGFMNPFVPDDVVLFMAQPDQNWMEIQRGTVSFPDPERAGSMGVFSFEEQRGPVVWSIPSHNPTGMQTFLKTAFGVAAPNPNAWVYFDTTP